MKLNHKGFTLIEIAVVLIIVGLLIGFGASMVRPLFERSRRIETQESVKAAVESVVPITQRSQTAGCRSAT